MAALIEAGCTSATIEAARLLTSELVTNVVLHSASENLTVAIVVEEPWCRVSVEDGDVEVLPDRRAPAPTDTGGRGLLLVEALSERWDVEIATEPPGKVVWFELRCA